MASDDSKGGDKPAAPGPMPAEPVDLTATVSMPQPEPAPPAEGGVDLFGTISLSSADQARAVAGVDAKPAADPLPFQKPLQSADPDAPPGGQSRQPGSGGQRASEDTEPFIGGDTAFLTPEQVPPMAALPFQERMPQAQPPPPPP
ncbi:MAG: hypothetical protein JRI23_03290, partial [Deltaproteobacteria bacterium]|nr:hypothetical protein [Deltaproteobacteria bacterium]MBW2530534.1 hypothetical protein [Deltaproteobacteria bacterium]